MLEKFLKEIGALVVLINLSQIAKCSRYMGTILCVIDSSQTKFVAIILVRSVFYMRFFA